MAFLNAAQYVPGDNTLEKKNAQNKCFESNQTFFLKNPILFTTYGIPGPQAV